MFETTARVAIEEMIVKNSKAGKFGLILSKENINDLINDFYDLLQTSRNLKSAGDRIIRQGIPPTNQTSASRTR